MQRVYHVQPWEIRRYTFREIAEINSDYIELLKREEAQWRDLVN